MEFEKFKQKLGEVLNVLGVDFKFIQITKNNNLVLEAVNVFRTDTNVTPTIYLAQYWYQACCGRPIQEIAREILQIVVEESNRKIDMEWFKDFQQVKDKIRFKVINFEQNKELLEKIPHKKVLDLAMVYYVAVESRDIGFGTILLYNNHLDLWGANLEEIDALAEENTPKYYPAEITKMDSVLKQLLNSGDINTSECEKELMLKELEEMEEDKDYMSMYILSNNKKVDGAATLFYKDSLVELSQKVNSDLYILPSSVHELIVIPYKEGDRECLKNMVREVNDTQVEHQDILSYNVYLYERSTDEVKIV